jgi:hypothetical protein
MNKTLGLKLKRKRDLRDGDERCLLPKGAQFVVQWRYGDKERESLCVRREVPIGVGTEVTEVGTAGRDRAKELFSEVAEYHGFEIEEMEVAADHVHIFVSRRSVRYRR